MKQNHSRLRFITPLLALALSAGAAFAGTESTTATLTEPTDWLKVSGYANMSYAYTNFAGGGDGETFADSGANNLDSIKVGFTGTFGSFSGYVSLFYVPNAADEAGILDAYVTYTAGPVSITGGKYLSYLGYEAFDAVNMSQLTYANNTLGAIPAYHTGIKVDYASDVWAFGASVSDSIRGNYEGGFFEGDNDYSDDLGFEAYVSYKGIEDLTIWFGVGYEDSDEAFYGEWVTYDLWASYKLTDKLTVAAEAAYHAEEDVIHGMQYLAFASYAFTEKFSLVGRLGYDDIRNDGAGNSIRYTLAPSYSFDEHFTLRGEVTYNDGDFDGGEYVFYGVQGLLKF